MELVLMDEAQPKPVKSEALITWSTDVGLEVIFCRADAFEEGADESSPPQQLIIVRHVAATSARRLQVMAGMVLRSVQARPLRAGSFEAFKSGVEAAGELVLVQSEAVDEIESGFHLKKTGNAPIFLGFEVLGFAGGAALRARTEVLLLGQDDRLEVAAQSPEGGKEVEGGEEGAGAEVLLSAFPAKAGTLGITFARHDNLTLVTSVAPGSAAADVGGLSPGLILTAVAGPAIHGEVFVPVEACSFSQTLYLIQSAGRPLRLAFRKHRQQDASSQYWQTAEAGVLLRHNDTKKAGYLLVQSQQQAGGRKRGGMRTWSRDKQPKPKAAMTENAGQEKFVVLISDRLLLYDKVVAGNESGASSGGGVDGVKAMELGLAETLLLEGLTVALSVGGAKAGQAEALIIKTAEGESIELTAQNPSQIRLWFTSLADAKRELEDPGNTTPPDGDDGGGYSRGGPSRNKPPSPAGQLGLTLSEDEGSVEGLVTSPVEPEVEPRRTSQNSLLGSGQQQQRQADPVRLKRSSTVPKPTPRPFWAETEEKAEEKAEVNAPAADVDQYGFQIGGYFSPRTHTRVRQETQRQDRDQRKSRAKQAAKWTQWDIAAVKNAKTAEMVRRGIPSAVRLEKWAILGGAHRKQAECDSESYSRWSSANKFESSKAMQEVEKDLTRTFPKHEIFNKQAGLDALRRVLSAYAWRNPGVGYCQSMNFVAATLLLLSSSAAATETAEKPTVLEEEKEEAAFWVLCSIIEDILPDYYTHDMLGIQSDAQTLTALLEAQLPDLLLHMDNLGVIPNVFCIEWFMKIYVTVLPFDTALRVWDCLFGSSGDAEGPCVLISVALAVLTTHRRELLKVREAEHFMGTLKQRCANSVDADMLLRKALDKKTLARVSEMRQLTFRASLSAASVRSMPSRSSSVSVSSSAASSRPKAKKRSETVAVVSSQSQVQAGQGAGQGSVAPAAVAAAAASGEGSPGGVGGGPGPRRLSLSSIPALNIAEDARADADLVLGPEPTTAPSGRASINTAADVWG